MTARWSNWKAELETLSVFAEEWQEGQVEDFVQGVQRLAADKRARRETILKLGDELKDLRTAFQGVLSFFDLDRGCAAWSALNCPEADLDRVLNLLADWRAQLCRYNAKYPPNVVDCGSYAALQTFIREAENASETIRGGFTAVNALFAPAAPPEAAKAPESPVQAAAAVEQPPAPAEPPSTPQVVSASQPEALAATSCVAQPPRTIAAPAPMGQMRSAISVGVQFLPYGFTDR